MKDYRWPDRAFFFDGIFSEEVGKMVKWLEFGSCREIEIVDVEER